MSLMKFFTGGITGYLITASVTAAIVGVPAWMGAHNVGYASATKEYRVERTVWLKREVLLWNELGAERQTKRELIESIEKMVNTTGKARSQMLAELNAQKQRLEVAEQAAAAAIKRLDHVENTWKDERVPDDVVCVFNTRGCDEPGPSGAGRGDDVAVRGGAPAGVD